MSVPQRFGTELAGKVGYSLRARPPFYGREDLQDFCFSAPGAWGLREARDSE